VNRRTNQDGFISVIIIAFLLIGSIVFAGYFYLQKNSSSSFPEILNQISVSPVGPTSYPKLETNTDIVTDRTRYILYVVDEEGFRQISTFSDIASNPTYGNIPPYLDEESGALYLADAHSVSQYNLSGKKSKDIYTNTEKDLLVSYLSFIKKSIYISLLPNTYEKLEGRIDEVDIPTGKIRKIGSFAPILYGNLNYLFKTTKGDDVIGSFGGDGCGGGGWVKLLTAPVPKTIIETGGGCNEAPRYLGAVDTQDKIVLLSVVKDTWNETNGEQTDKLYIKNVYTGEEAVLYDFKANNERVSTYYENNQSNLLYIITNSKIKQLDLSDGTLKSDFVINSTIGPIVGDVRLQNDTLYSLGQDPYTHNYNMVFRSTNLKTGVKKEYDWGKKFPDAGQSYFTGLWHGDPIVSLYFFPTQK